MSYNCPICNKHGLDDYNESPIICPQCNSDLSGFMLLNQALKENKNKLRKIAFLLGVPLLIFAICTPAYFVVSNKPTQKISESSVILPDSLEYFRSEVNKTQNELNIKLQEIPYVNYIVKRGDNLSKIAFFFFNDATQYKKIEKDNNLSDNHILMPKDTLRVYLRNK